MGHRTVDDALEAGGRLRVAVTVEHETRQLVIDIAGQFFPQQIKVDVAGAHHSRGVAVVQERQQQMLERRVFVTALVRILKPTSQSLL